MPHTYLLLVGFCTVSAPLFHPFLHFPAPTNGQHYQLYDRNVPYMGPQPAYLTNSETGDIHRFRHPNREC